MINMTTAFPKQTPGAQDHINTPATEALTQRSADAKEELSQVAHKCMLL